MAVLNIPELKVKITNPEEIKAYLNNLNVFFDQWEADKQLKFDASQEDILEAYKGALEPYMKKNGYKVADVVNIHPNIENYVAIRNKFLAEHIHSEDEVRFFVEGEGFFWFNMENANHVFNVLCQAGDLISVPKGVKHWFDAGKENPNVKAIRIFIDTEGWVPQYTESRIEQNFLTND